MTEHITYKPHGVCSRNIDIYINGENDTIESVKFTGGCPGNAIGISSLIKGMKIDEVIARLKGIKCGYKNTSCPDQLAFALYDYIQNKNNQEG